MENQLKQVKRAYFKVKEKFADIETDKDLRKHKLTLEEYHTLSEVLNIAFQNPKVGVYCFSESVAEWCKKAGLNVVEPHEGDYYTCVNYTISVM